MKFKINRAHAWLACTVALGNSAASPNMSSTHAVNPNKIAQDMDCSQGCYIRGSRTRSGLGLDTLRLAEVQRVPAMQSCTMNSHTTCTHLTFFWAVAFPFFQVRTGSCTRQQLQSPPPCSRCSHRSLTPSGSAPTNSTLT